MKGFKNASYISSPFPKLAWRKDIQITRGRWTLPEGIRTEVIDASILAGDDIGGYDPAQDADLYQYFLAEEQDEGNCR